MDCSRHNKMAKQGWAWPDLLAECFRASHRWRGQCTWPPSRGHQLLGHLLDVYELGILNRMGSWVGPSYHKNSLRQLGEPNKHAFQAQTCLLAFSGVLLKASDCDRRKTTWGLETTHEWEWQNRVRSDKLLEVSQRSREARLYGLGSDKDPFLLTVIPSSCCPLNLE